MAKNMVCYLTQFDESSALTTNKKTFEILMICCGPTWAWTKDSLPNDGHGEAGALSNKKSR